MPKQKNTNRALPLAISVLRDKNNNIIVLSLGNGLAKGRWVHHGLTQAGIINTLSFQIKIDLDAPTQEGEKGNTSFFSFHVTDSQISTMEQLGWNIQKINKIPDYLPHQEKVDLGHFLPKEAPALPATPCLVAVG